MDCGLTHHEEEVYDDEDMSPTLENLVVLLWLKLIHPDLPRLVKWQFGTELRRQTLASLRCEISQCLPSLLAKVNGTNEPAICLSRPTQSHKPSTRECPICKAARKPSYDHYLTQCKYLPETSKHS